MNLDETGATLVSDLVPGFDSVARFLCSLPITMCFLCPAPEAKLHFARG